MLVKLAIDIYSRQPLDEAQRNAIEQHTERVLEELDMNCTLILVFNYHDEAEPHLTRLATSIFGEANLKPDLVILTIGPESPFRISLAVAAWISYKFDGLQDKIGRQILVSVRSKPERNELERLISLN